ncbi:MAG: DUF86 domain-containing protein [Chlamydiae bacterium]|nr:DUF86 domain-containing protein [Chlamydiota bacterium]MBI3265538.1 DUF86 domain-containing protein [Chlamydiota bacterium]
MSNRDIEHYIVDLVVAIFKINYMVQDFRSEGDLLKDFKSYDAVLRELQIIGEAIGNLLKNSILDEQYRKIVDFRNKITHEYFGVDIEIVWAVLKEEIPLLDKMLFKLSKGYSEKTKLIEAVDCALIDHQRIKQKVVEDFLKKFRKNLI